MIQSTHELTSTAKAVHNITAWIHNEDAIFVVTYDGVDLVVRLDANQLDALEELVHKLQHHLQEVTEVQGLWSEMQTWINQDVPPFGPQSQEW